MSRFRFRVLWLAVLALVACSSDEKPKPTDPSDTLPPSVTGIAPAEGATDLRLLQPFTLCFSEAMRPASLNPQTVRLGPDVPIQIHLAEHRDSLIVQPDTLLPADQAVTLTIDGATDLSGNALPPFTFHGRTGPLDCAHLGDRFEPNEDALTATEVRVDSTYVGLSTCLDDVDLYRFAIQDTMQIVAKTFIKYANSDPWGIFWIRGDGQEYATLGTTAHSGSTPSFRHTFLPGTYYLEIFGQGEEERVIYDLRLESVAPCRDDAYEDNDFEDEAAAIDPGFHPGLTGCYLDADWFRLPVRAGQTLTLTMDTHEYQGHRRLTIRLGPINLVLDPTEGETVSNLGLTATADGEALLMCMVWEDGVVYDMTITVTD